MNILVTGGAGFIASHIVDSYVKSGHKVFVVDNESSGKRAQVNSKAFYKKLDIRDAKALRAFVKGRKIQIVNHHAAQIDVRKSVENPVFDAQVNILGLLNILEIVRENRVKKIIFSSSGGTVYGECPRPAKEGNPEIPMSPYGVAKLASEKYIKAYSSLYGISYTIFRYSNVYGPRQDPHGEAGVVAIYSEKFLNKETPLIFGKGHQSRDFVYVGDIARANVMALQKGNNQTINIGTGKETSVLELFRKMAMITNADQNPIFKPARTGELQRSVLNISYSKKVLGWVPEVSLQDGLSKTISYFRNRAK